MTNKEIEAAIFKAVYCVTGFSYADVFSKSRKADFITLRGIADIIFNDMASGSQEEKARYLGGNRERTTILSSISRTRGWIRRMPYVRKLYEDILDETTDILSGSGMNYGVTCDGREDALYGKVNLIKRLTELLETDFNEIIITR